jgi:hypothetical protein
MKFANPKAAAAYAAQAATPKPMPSTGGPRQAVIPKPNLPIRGVGTNDGGPKPMPSTGGPRQVIAPKPVITPNPSRMPKNAGPGNVEQNYRGIPGLVNATAPIGGPGAIKGPFPTKTPLQPATGAPSSFYNSLMGGGAAPSQPVMGNNIANTGATAFKRSPATFQSGMKKGGTVSSASKRADGIAQRGKTRA